MDFLKDGSFINYCRRSNAADIQYWEQYIASHPEQKEQIEEAAREYQLLFTALANNDLEEQLQQLKAKVEGGEQAPVVKLRPKKRNWYKYGMVAAAVIMAIVISPFLFRTPTKPTATPQPVIQYTSNHGERKDIRLPDGTQVSLNAGSEIVLNDHYGHTSREITLKGEAFFDVQHNKEVPFIVHTGSMDVKALGTAFNVKSYEGERRTETVLVRGLIEVTLKQDNNRRVLLHPDQKLSWTEPYTSKTDKESARIQPLKKLDNGQVKELAWVANNLAFENDTFEDIARQLNRWYNVHIEFQTESVKHYHFTATFTKEKIEQVLNILKASKKFNYKVNGQTILIY